jgi:hypothetical protein
MRMDGVTSCLHGVQALCRMQGWEKLVEELVEERGREMRNELGLEQGASKHASLAKRGE